MKINNSLTRKIEEFVPLKKGVVEMYTCGPTVYDYPTIGNWRTYTTGDVIFRTMKYLGYGVKYVMNLTDVGHLTGDNEGDADQGEDRLEKAAKRERKTAWEIADFYTKDFIEGMEKLNLVKPQVLARATEHIVEQIALIKKIEEKGFAYRIEDGIYFDTGAYETAGNKYGELSTLDQIREGARVEVNQNKRDARDFALWKFSPVGEKRDMEWESPWGIGFPGWHIECSAMSMKYLGEQFDLHVGGEDLRSTHHPNEIAQSEAGTGKKPFVRYWVHGAFLLVDGGRMGKSLGNAYTLSDVQERGFEPLDLRYFYLMGHYRKQINFTWEALGAAREARLRLVRIMSEDEGITEVGNDEGSDFEQEFQAALENDLNMPEALAVVWSLTKSELSGRRKKALLEKFDSVLGLNLVGESLKKVEVPSEIQELVTKREEARQEKNWESADRLREEIQKLGWVVEDVEGKSVVKKV